MGKILLVLAFCSVSVFAQEINRLPDGSITITLNKEQAEECKNNGGCAIIPMKLLEALVWESAKQMCGKRI